MALKSIPRFAPRPIKADICVIGGGVGGLAVAAASAQLGARTILVEREEFGENDRPSPSLASTAFLAAINERWRGGAAAVRTAAFEQVRAHMSSVLASSAPNMSRAHCEALGVQIIRAQARFRDRRRIMAGNQEIRARRMVIATGSRPLIPAISGLTDISFFTSDTIFSNDTLPEHLVILGGGPFGMEMAQAHRRLGARVTLIETMRVLGAEDQEFAELAADTLRSEGCDIIESAKILRVASDEGRILVELRDGDGERQVSASHLLVATGRRPNLETLHLDRAGIVATPLGIKVDDHMRTSNRNVFALGDVAALPAADLSAGVAAHIATHQAEIIIKNALFRTAAKADYYAAPRVIYTDPELAHVGQTEAEARKVHKHIKVLRWPLAENDRARALGLKRGMIRIITDRHSRILGATIFAPQASDLIVPWLLARSRGLRLSAVTRLIMPHPSFSEISKQAAFTYYIPQLFGERARALVRFLRFWS